MRTDPPTAGFPKVFIAAQVCKTLVNLLKYNRSTLFYKMGPVTFLTLCRTFVREAWKRKYLFRDSWIVNLWWPPPPTPLCFPSPKHWIYFKPTVSILCLYIFITPAEIQCPSLYINQALLSYSFFKILIYISCCPWSRVDTLCRHTFGHNAVVKTSSIIPA